MRRPAILMFVIFMLGCSETGAEAPPSHSAVPRPSGRQATLTDWLPPEAPGTRRPAAEPASPHGGAAPSAAAPAAPSGGVIRGTVTETMDSGGYTYMHVDTSNGPVWVASVQREVAVGATVQASGAMMQSFRSNTLNRTFERLVLATSVEVVPSE